MNYSVNVLLVVLVAAQIAYGFVPYRFGARTAVRGLSAIDQVGKVVELEVPMDGENVKFIFSEEHKQNEVVLEVTSDEKVTQGVIAVAVGSLKASNVGSVITGFQKLQD